MLACSASAASTMDEAVDVSNSVLDHNINVINVQTSGCNIGSYKDCSAFRITVFIKDLSPFSLLHITVQAHEPSVLERAELFSFVFGFSKDQYFFILVFCYKVFQHQLFLAVRVAKKANVFYLLGNLSRVCAH